MIPDVDECIPLPRAGEMPYPPFFLDWAFEPNVHIPRSLHFVDSDSLP